MIGTSVLQGMDVAAQERLEASADSTGVSSLIAPIGGLATYPSMVLEDNSAQRVLSSVAHEWLHQYLIFYPLGAEYWSSQQTREINETTAEMLGQEVGTRLAESLQLSPPPRVPSEAATQQPSSGFDFRAFMRETRLETERLLSAGEVDPAEGYMRDRRAELEQHGYRIRKLNQAYFALYGSYGEGFAASPANPIPGLLHALRDTSPTLGDFVSRSLAWLVRHQNADGGYGDTVDSPSNISTTTLCWASLGLGPGTEAAVARAEAWLKRETGDLRPESLATQHPGFEMALS